MDATNVEFTDRYKIQEWATQDDPKEEDDDISLGTTHQYEKASHDDC